MRRINPTQQWKGSLKRLQSDDSDSFPSNVGPTGKSLKLLAKPATSPKLFLPNVAWNYGPSAHNEISQSKLRPRSNAILPE